MRKIKEIIIHCSATKEGRNFTVADIGGRTTMNSASAPTVYSVMLILSIVLTSAVPLIAASLILNPFS